MRRINYTVRFRELPERHIASICQRIPTYGDEHLLWRCLRNEVERIPIRIANPSWPTAVYHDHAQIQDEVEVEVQISVVGRYANTDRIRFWTEKSCGIVSTVHSGTLPSIGAAVQAVTGWLKRKSYVIDGPMFSIYHFNPFKEQRTGQRMTEICFPVKKKQ